MKKEKLSKELVSHVAKLARLKISEEEIVKYQSQLGNILNEINKIDNANISENEILIAPTTNKNVLREDKVGEMIDIIDAFKNVNNINGDYIEVVGVINE